MANQINIQNQLDLLGRPARDRVTGFKGIISSICFDLYGCVQAVIQPKVDSRGQYPDGRYIDVSRLEVESTKRVMPLPAFESFDKGPAEKPQR